MSALARIAAFAAALAILAGAAAAVGYAVGPLGHGKPDSGERDHAAERAGSPAGPAGLSIAEGGARLVAARTMLTAGRAQTFSFRVEGVRSYDLQHERRMHLILVRRDLSGFVHLHPVQHGDRWTAAVPALAPGSYRAFADFSTGGEKRVLGVDVLVPGAPLELPLPRAAVRLERTRLHTGREETLVFHPNEAIGRYLGARGHLVVLREGDLGYLHVHADEDELHFETTFPSAGRYRAFLQYRSGGALRTAAFDLEVSP